MTDGVWLAFDIGTTGLKAALVSAAGQVLSSFTQDYPVTLGQDGVVEQDTAGWTHALLTSARMLDLQRYRDQLAGVALTGQMQDLILFDDDKFLVRPVILYSDTRARQEADIINMTFGAQRLLGLTGSDHDASSLLSKLLWVKRHEPENYRSTRTVLMGAADYMADFLCGELATDTTTASTTSLLELESRRPLPDDLFRAAGIEEAPAMLPRIVPGGAQVGATVEAYEEIIGLPAGLPVHLGPGDAGAVTLGVGAGEPGRVYAYLGTSGWIAFTSETRAVADGVITLAHPQPGRYIQIAPLLTAGGNLEWVRDLFGSASYDEVISQALAGDPGSLIYLPYLNGERSPFRDPAARGAFVGLTGRTRREDLYRAVLEGVAFAYRHALDALVDFQIDSLTLAGGGAKSTAWAQLIADILNVPVEIQDQAGYAGVRGAVMAALVQRGELDRYAFRNPPPPQTRLEPRDEHRTHYDRQYRLFRDLYPALRQMFAGMAGTLSSDPSSTANDAS
mgnify:CR=1 FL=1